MLPEINNIYIFVPVLNYQRKKNEVSKKHDCEIKKVQMPKQNKQNKRTCKQKPQMFTSLNNHFH